MSLKYDPRKVIITYNGVPLSGFSGGSFVTCTRRKPLARLEELGADGEGAFVLTGDHSYDIELQLKKSSPSNAILSQFAQAIALGAPLFGVFAVMDLSMVGAYFTAVETMITETPPFAREGGDKLGDNTWKFQAKSGVEFQPGGVI